MPTRAVFINLQAFYALQLRLGRRNCGDQCRLCASDCVEPHVKGGSRIFHAPGSPYKAEDCPSSVLALYVFQIIL